MSQDTGLPPWKTQFIQDCTGAGCLSFGSFTLKSGRQSPYFFNSGNFYTSTLLRSLATAFSETIHNAPSSSTTSATTAQSIPEFDVLFGPACKGTPLAVAVTMQLGVLFPAQFPKISYAFDRKEKKNYGDGGLIVGSPLKGKRVVIIDDVMTAGTAIGEAVQIIKSQGGELVGIVVLFDRMETMPGTESRRSTIAEVREKYQVPVKAVITLDDIMESLKGAGNEEDLGRLREYRETYGATG